ncbi:hypothetical protein OG21DRAFT_245025 [Imleria badia]|nr:hypothetical protein OG21DRAFT_245025 [Imleria badia]
MLIWPFEEVIVVSRRKKYQSVLEMCESPVDIARVDLRLGKLSLALGDLNNARKLFIKALPFFESDISAVLEQAQTLYQLGEVELSFGQEQLAGDYFERSLAVCGAAEIIPTQIDSLVKLAEGAMRQSKPQEAAARYKNAIALYLQVGDDVSAQRYTEVLQSLPTGTQKPR